MLGIGFGFRNDLLINILPWVAVVLLCLPGRLLSNLEAESGVPGGFGAGVRRHGLADSAGVCTWRQTGT